MARHPDAPGTPATAALDAAGIPFVGHVYQHDPRSTNFGEEAAEKLGVDPDRVFKTLVAEVAGSLVVGVVPVTAMLDLRALAVAAGGGKATLADPRLAERRSGYVVGGISPIGQKTPLRTVVDETAILFETVLVSGGRRGFDIELAPDDLCAATGAVYAPISARRR
ncbi:Cys-tRNA(Pro) deacylase [Glaciibacter flavus]|uniref:Cys-tRNA(Pro)/Cys-tRNA(Cys) deacylase n=1 Tax=Orlajensenia flava TaxID=2565934 RepID=A0A4V3WU93_9MICO|nr:Cys-tRNA(Pro) deacylase [Glaciibacter flavus]THG35007.1 Cys-tRNA(Pro) deacylase [Glaciibacter flavus]